MFQLQNTYVADSSDSQIYFYTFHDEHREATKIAKVTKAIPKDDKQPFISSIKITNISGSQYQSNESKTWDRHEIAAFQELLELVTNEITRETYAKTYRQEIERIQIERQRAKAHEQELLALMKEEGE
jgi:hypothetical protein